MKDPEVAKEFASKTKSIKSLPEHTSKTKTMQKSEKGVVLMKKKMGKEKKMEKYDKVDSNFMKSMVKAHKK